MDPKTYRTNLRDRLRLERTNRAKINQVLRQARDAAVAAARRGDLEGIPSAAVAVLNGLGEVLVDGAVTAHLQGYRRSLAAYESKPGARKAQLSVQSDAARFARARMRLTAADILALREMYSSYTLDILSNATDRLESQLQRTVARVIREGYHVRAGAEAIQQVITELPKDFNATGLSRRNPYLAETLYRSQVNLAYMAGRLNANDDPDIQEILWGYEYVTAQDDRVRPNHWALHGLRLPKDHPRWGEVMPPNGFNCRCDVIEVFIDEVDAAQREAPEQRDEEGEVIKSGADPGWVVHPGKLFKDVLSFRR